MRLPRDQSCIARGMCDCLWVFESIILNHRRTQLCLLQQSGLVPVPQSVFM
jgi:hypothetical protein